MAFSLKPDSSADRFIRAGFFVLVALFLLVSSLIFFGAPGNAATPAEQGQAIFEQKCKACHTIGGGRLVGPDLKGVTANRDVDWLVGFITAPDKVIAAGDPIAQQLVQQYGLPMPNLGVTEADARAVLAYLDTQSGGSKPAPTPTQTTTAPPPVPTPTLILNDDTGRDLFTGRLTFKNGGPACLSCHNISAAGFIGGGTVGKDLTNAYATMGEAAIRSILKTTPFPMMKQIYTQKPLTDNEITDVLAFLKSASSTPSAPSQNSSLFFIIGGASALLIIGVFQWLWRGRLSGVRRPLVKGGSK